MPFIEPSHRLNPDINLPGDKCYLFYKEMVERWKKEPRWATAYSIYLWVREGHNDPAMQRAKELAWQVFFILKVMPYEEEKMDTNGDI